MSDKAKSPDTLQLRKEPMIGPRLGKRAALISGAVVAVLLGVVIYNTESRQASNEAKPKQASSEASARLAPAVAGAEAFTRGVSDEVKVTVPTAAPSPFLDLDAAFGAQSPQGAAARPTGSQGQTAGTYAVPDLTGAGGAYHPVPELEVSDADRRLAEERVRLETEARRRETKINGWSSSYGGTAAATAPAASVTAGGAAVNPDANLAAQMAAMAGLAGQQQVDDQEKKREFLAGATQIEAPYLAATRQPPRSAYELKTGTIIPGVMISGINSDLPGEVSAMVTDNVYDTATGRHLLIPAWTKLFGRYDSSVAYGQRRALVVWTRLIYPDGSTLELGGMPGADVGGYAGFEDKVDNHFGRLIGFSILSSVMSAGLQLSQPDEGGANGQLSNRQIVAASVGQELSQLGVEVTRRNLNVQPTIRVRNGYRFTITVNRDVAFAGPYVAK